MKDVMARHVRTNMKIRISRSIPSDPLLNGYLLDLSDSLALMHVFHDFQPEGYIIFRIQDVEKVRCGPYEHFWDQMLRAEERLGGLNLKCQPDLSNMRSAIESLAQHYDHLIVECEDTDREEEDFYIGALVSTGRDSIVIRHFDALGYSCNEPAEIDIEEITMVQFDTPYINIFSKYLRDGEPPELPDED